MTFWLKGKWRGAGYQSGSGTDTLRFAYTIGQEKADYGIVAKSGAEIGSAGTVIEGGGTLTAVDSNNTVYKTFSRSKMNIPSHRVDGTIGITGVSVTSTPADGTTYRQNENIDIEVTFNGIVKTSGGIHVTFWLGRGSNWRGAGYQSGSGSEVLKFRYTIGENDIDDTGISIGSAGNVIEGSGALKAGSSNINAKRTFPRSQIDNPAHAINGTSITNDDCRSEWNKSHASNHCRLTSATADNSDPSSPTCDFRHVTIKYSCSSSTNDVNYSDVSNLAYCADSNNRNWGVKDGDSSSCATRPEDL